MFSSFLAKGLLLKEEDSWIADGKGLDGCCTTYMLDMGLAYADIAGTITPDVAIAGWTAARQQQVELLLS